MPVSSASGMAAISFLIVQKKSRGDTNGVFSNQGPVFKTARLQQCLAAQSISHTLSFGYNA